MVVSVIDIEIHLPEARSLKDKRRIVKSLKDKIHSRFRVSIAEVDRHDVHQRARIGIAAVAPELSRLEAISDSIRRLFDSRHELIVTDWREHAVELPV